MSEGKPLAEVLGSLGFKAALEQAELHGDLQLHQGCLKSLVTRKFVLLKPRDDLGGVRALVFFRKEADARPRGHIALSPGCSVIPKLVKGKHGVMVVTTDQQEHLFFASSKKEVSKWIVGLEGATAPPAPAAARASSQASNRAGPVQKPSLFTPPTIRDPDTKHVREITTLYSVHEELGAGGFAVVKRGVRKSDGLEVALKMTPLATYRRAKARTDSEIMVLSACNHNNIMRLYEVVKTQESLVMSVELLTGKELFDRVVAREKYTENDAKEVASSLLEAVNYLHSNGIVHRDLKPENLIFDRPGDDAVLKLTDFGFATIMKKNEKLRSACGTPEYVAPEVLSDKPYDQSADMWSCGVIIYILLCGYPPFYGQNEHELFEKILKCDFEFHLRFWGKISHEAKDLIRKLIEPNPLKRLTAKQALQHPWLRRDVADGANENMSDALIQLKRFHTARKFRKGVLTVMAANRLFDLS